MTQPIGHKANNIVIMMTKSRHVVLLPSLVGPERVSGGSELLWQQHCKTGVFITLWINTHNGPLATYAILPGFNSGAFGCSAQGWIPAAAHPPVRRCSVTRQNVEVQAVLHLLERSAGTHVGTQTRFHCSDQSPGNQQRTCFISRQQYAVTYFQIRANIFVYLMCAHSDVCALLLSPLRVDEW